MDVREELIIKAASKVHSDWCTQELKGFHSRAQEIKNTGEITNPGEILRAACYKNGKPRNEVFIDAASLQRHGESVERIFSDYEFFEQFVNSGDIEVKRFSGRDLTPEEQVETASTGNYKVETGEENILRSFKDLSADSKKENLEAALGAFNVYEQLSKAGVTLDQMQNDSQIKGIIGVAIHADWLKRNMDHPNNDLKVAYSELDSWTQQQDLTVFSALLDVVKTNQSKYSIQPVPGYQIPDYQALEQETLSSIKQV